MKIEGNAIFFASLSALLKAALFFSFGTLTEAVFLDAAFFLGVAAAFFFFGVDDFFFLSGRYVTPLMVMKFMSGFFFFSGLYLTPLMVTKFVSFLGGMEGQKKIIFREI